MHLLALLALLNAGCTERPSTPLQDAGTGGDGGADAEAPSPPPGPEPTFPFVGPEPGRASAVVTEGGFTIENDVLEASFERDGESFALRSVHNRMDDNTFTADGALFSLRLRDGRQLSSSSLRTTVQPVVVVLEAEDAAPRQAERYAGVAVELTLVDEVTGLAAVVRVTLRDGSSYLRTEVSLTATAAPVPLEALVLLEAQGTDAYSAGLVPGSVAVSGSFYAGYEHPMADNHVGAPKRRVGTWGERNVSWPERSNLELDVTDAVRAAGTTEITFQYLRGGYRLEVYRVSIFENGREVARDEHFGATGAVDVDNTWRLVLQSYDPEAEYTVVADIRSDGGLDSNGEIWLQNGPEDRIELSFSRNADITSDAFVQSSVIGVVPEGQLRRAFLHYLERERSHPYRPFLHYNSWYDIGYFSQYDEAASLDVIEAYGTELVQRRGVTMDSLLLDDGWDDQTTLWAFHDGFPSGFAPLQRAAAEYGFAPGVWLSPFGGYGDPREQRLIAGAAAGFETNEQGFVLSGPQYYERFRDICLTMVRDYGINQFKFDGVGRASAPWPGSPYGSDFEAAIALIGDLRAESPDVYVNLTSGTWPSPFWLRHADSIWRGGYDHELIGVGSDRQQWMTYRDAMTYERVVLRSPLFPLSALMLHGVIYAQHARDLQTDPDGDLRSEIRSFFGSGTQVQELYVTPALMTEQNWDDLAESAKWARERADILQDTHFIGDDPGRLRAYGWAAWRDDRAVVVLRNPSDNEVTFPLVIDRALELPADAPRRWELSSPYVDQRVGSLSAEAGIATEITLEPFEVLVFDGAAD